MIGVLYLHNKAQVSGGERGLLALWENLDRSRFRPFLAVPEEGLLAEKARALGVGVSVIPVPAFRPWHVVGLWRAGQALARLVRENGICVIHSYTPRNNLLSALVGKRAGAAVVWHERNLTYGREWDVSAMLASLPDAVICNSAAISRRFVKKGAIPAKVRVIYNGIDTDYFRPQDADEAKRRQGLAENRVVGLVSNLNLRKNVGFFLDVAAIVHARIPKAFFVIVGGDFGSAAPARSGLEEQARRLGLTDCVIFSGFQDDIRPCLSAFDVYCSVTEREACSRALLEAMAMGKPCVALRDGGNPELISDGETGSLVPVGDENAFADAVTHLLRDAQLREGYGRKGRERVCAAFDVRQNALSMGELYVRLAEGRA